MRQQKTALLILLLASTSAFSIERKQPERKPAPGKPAPTPAPAARPTPPPNDPTTDNNDLSASGSLDDLLRDMIGKLEKDRATAQDAAIKLGKLGKRAVPVLTELVERNFKPDVVPPDETKVPAPGPRVAPAPAAVAEKTNPQVLFFSVMALSRIKLADAARPLLPVLRSSKTDPEIRMMIIESPGLEMLDEGAALMQKIAASDPDMTIRKKAFSQLSLMAKYWAQSEKLYTDALSDPDEEIRLLAAKQCYWTMIYLGATEKLTEMIEKDPSPPVRIQCILALGRMRAKSCVPALMRVLQSTDSTPQLQGVALRSLSVLTTIVFKDAAGAVVWWKKFGEVEYSKFEIPVAVPQPAAPAVAPPVTEPPPVKETP